MGNWCLTIFKDDHTAFALYIGHDVACVNIVCVMIDPFFFFLHTNTVTIACIPTCYLPNKLMVIKLMLNLYYDARNRKIIMQFTHLFEFTNIKFDNSLYCVYNTYNSLNQCGKYSWTSYGHLLVRMQHHAKVNVKVLQGGVKQNWLVIHS